MSNDRTERRSRIHRGIRKKISGSGDRPRLSVFRSNTEIYAQIIDDTTGKTLASAGSLKNDAASGVAKKDQATVVGKMIAENAVKAGIQQVVFDRNGYLYHGRVKCLADSAREAGLKF